MLALAGASYQGVFRNPLADPYLLGIAAGAGLGATLAIAYAHGTVEAYDLVPLAAFLGGSLGVVGAYALGSSGGGRSPAALILAGVTIACFLTVDPDLHPAAERATRCRRSTAGSSAASTRPAGTRWRSSRRTSPSARS